MDTKHPFVAARVPAIGRTRNDLFGLTGLLLVSIAVHAGAVVAIGADNADPPPKVRAPTLVTMTVEPARPAPEAAADPEVPRAAQPIAPKRVVRAPAKPVVATPPPAAAKPEAETPADFTGVTLTNDGPGAGWASSTGNGSAMTGPIGTPGARVTGRSRGGNTGGSEPAPKSEGPPILKLADLSKPPRAPVLSEMLERNYPDQARRRGVPGKAVMRLRVMPDGHVRELIVLAESDGGFGEACKRTLRDSRWSPPLDLEARPVSTFVSYTCTFEVH